MSIASPDQLEISLAAVSGPIREKNHAVLQPILTDLIAYGLNVKQLHWNVVGPNFRPIHLFLDEIYEHVQEAIDTVAERLSMTGHSPDGRVTAVAANTELEDVPEGFTHDTKVLTFASERTRELIGLIRSRMESIEDVDTVTADLLHQIVYKLESQHWMLQAQRV
jgi:starvation-inducible DNA-binding protein